jgi:hypothetical protein
MLAKLPVRALHQLGIKSAGRGFNRLGAPLRPIVRDGSAAAPFPRSPTAADCLPYCSTSPLRSGIARSAFSTATAGNATGLRD